MFLRVITELLMFLRVITALLMFLRVITVSYYTIITAIQHILFLCCMASVGYKYIYIYNVIYNSYTTVGTDNDTQKKYRMHCYLALATYCNLCSFLLK